MSGRDFLPWLCLAFGCLGLLAMVMAWFSTKARDGAFLFYTFMVLVGFGAFFALR